MMWLFGQVFLLCLASFLTGGLAGWLLLGRPLARPLAPALPRPLGRTPARTSAEPVIKGNTRTKRYHTPDSPYFNRTKGDILFATVAEAERAGYTPGLARRRAATTG